MNKRVKEPRYGIFRCIDFGIRSLGHHPCDLGALAQFLIARHIFVRKAGKAKLTTFRRNTWNLLQGFFV